MIENYLKNVDFSKDYSVNKMKMELRSILKETPGIEITHSKDTMITEDAIGSKKVVIDKVKSVVVAFSDGETSTGIPIIHKIEIYV